MPQDWFEQNKPVRRNYIPTQVEEEDDWFAKNRPEPTPPPAPVKRVNTSTEPTTLDKWVSGGLRTIPAVVGGVVGGTATGAATMGVGTLAGGSIGGAAGAGIGEGLAEWYEKVRGIRKEFNPAQVAVQTGVGAIPFLGKFPGAGATWGQVGKYAGRAALEGGVVNAAATVPTQLAETGELPSLPQVGEAGVMGGVMGGALGGGFAAYPKIRTKGIDPTALPAGKPNVKVVPDVDTSVVPPSGPPPTAPANGQPKSRVPSVATIQKRLGVSVEEATVIRDKIKSSIDMGVNPPVVPQVAVSTPSIPPAPPIQQPSVIPQQAQPLPPVTPIAQAPPTPKQKVVDAFEKAKQKVRALPSVESPIEPVKQPEVPPAPSETGFQVLLKKDGKYWVESPTLRRPSGPFNSDYLANKWVEANLNAPQVDTSVVPEREIRLAHVESKPISHADRVEEELAKYEQTHVKRGFRKPGDRNKIVIPETNMTEADIEDLRSIRKNKEREATFPEGGRFTDKFEETFPKYKGQFDKVVGYNEGSVSVRLKDGRTAIVGREDITDIALPKGRDYKDPSKGSSHTVMRPERFDKEGNFIPQESSKYPDRDTDKPFIERKPDKYYVDIVQRGKTYPMPIEFNDRGRAEVYASDLRKSESNKGNTVNVVGPEEVGPTVLPKGVDIESAKPVSGKVLQDVDTSVVSQGEVKALPPIEQPKETSTFKIKDKAGNVAPIPADEFEGLTPRLRIIVEDFNANGMDVAKTAKSLGISEANLQASLDSVRSITNVLPTTEGAVLTAAPKAPKGKKAKAVAEETQLPTTEPKMGKPGSTQRLAYTSWSHGQSAKERIAKLARIKGMPADQVDWNRDWYNGTEVRSIEQAEAEIATFKERQANAARNYMKAAKAEVEARKAATPEVDTSVVPKQVVKELPPVEQPKTEEPVNPHAETIKKHEATRSLSERYRAIVAEMDAAGAKDVEYRDVLSTGGKAELKKGETWRGRVLKFADMADIANKRMNLPEVETSVVPKEAVKELPKVESPIEAKPEPIEGESAVDFIKRTLNVPIEQFQKMPKEVQQQVLKEWRKGQDTFRGPDIEPKEMAVKSDKDFVEQATRLAKEQEEARYVQKVWDGQSEVRIGPDGNDVIHINRPDDYLSPKSKDIIAHSPAFKKSGKALKDAVNIILDAIERPLSDPTDDIGKEMFLIRNRLKRLGFAFTPPSGKKWGINVAHPKVNLREHAKLSSVAKLFEKVGMNLDELYSKANYEFGVFVDLPYIEQLSRNKPDNFIADLMNVLEHELAHNIMRDEMSYSHGARMAAIRRLSADKLPEIIDVLRKGFFDANGQHSPELLEVLRQVKEVPWTPDSSEFFVSRARVGKEGPTNIGKGQARVESNSGTGETPTVKETKEAYVSRVTGLTKEQFNKLPNRTRTAVLAGYSGAPPIPPTPPKTAKGELPPSGEPPKKKGVEPATIVGKVGRIFYKKFMEANPKFKEITDRLIKRRSASEIIGKQVRDEFKDEIGHISKDEIVPFQEDVENGKYPRVREFFDNLHALLESKGAKVGYKENYLPQMWDNTPEEVAAIFGNKTMREKASFQFRSFIDDYAEGIEKGLKPKMKPLELMDWYAQRVNKLIADRAALKSLRKQGYLVQAKNRTSGMQKIESKYGSFEGYYADPSVKAVLENYLGGQDQVGGGIGQALARFSGKMTNLALSSGLVPNKPLFTAHGANMAFPFMSRSFMEGGIKRNLKALKYAWSPEAAGKYLDENAKKAEYLTKRWGYRGQVENPSPGGNLFENTEGIFGKGKEAANKLSELQAKYFEKPLFDKTIPATKLEATWDNFQRNLKKGMTEDEAGKAAVKIGDSFYSGRNLDLMYHNKNFNTFAKIAMAAPDWFRSTVDLGINVPKSMIKILSNPKDPLTQAYAKAGGRMLAIYAAANLAQKAATGKFMWENSTSDQFTMKLGKDVENKKTRGLKIFNNAGDFFKIPMQIAKATVEEGGGAEVLESSLEGRGSPLTHAALAVASGEDYKGEKNIVGTRDRYGRQVPTAERLRNTLSQTINFGPPQAAAPYNYATGRMTGEEAIARVAEAPLKYGKKKKNPFAFEPFAPVPSNRRGKSVWDYGR